MASLINIYKRSITRNAVVALRWLGCKRSVFVRDNMATFRSHRRGKAIALTVFVLGCICLLFLTDFPRKLIPEISLDSVAVAKPHDHSHKQDHVHSSVKDDAKRNINNDDKKSVNVKQPAKFSLKPHYTITTSILNYVDGHEIGKLYGSKGFFWGINPKAGDYFEIVLDKLKPLSRIAISSGDKDHENDSLLDSDLSISTSPYEGRCSNYKQVERFKNKKAVEYQFKEKNMIQCARLTLSRVRTVNSNGQNHGDPYWLIISSITVT